MTSFSRRGCLVAGVGLSIGAFAKWQAEPDIVLHNGEIWTVAEQMPEVQALAISGGRILATGSNEEMLSLASSRTRRVDIARKRITPGFNDAHAHPIETGVRSLFEVAADKESIEAIVAAIRERAQNTPTGTWVLGFLYDDGKTSRPLTRWDLDRATREHPVRVLHRGGHTIFVNSLALQLAGVTSDTPDPEHGAYFRDPSGELNGRVADKATARFEELSDYTPDRGDYRRAAAMVSNMYASKGITSACEAAGSAEDLQAAQDAREHGELRMRMYVHIYHGEADKLTQAGIHSGFGDEWVRVGAIKFFLDGSISERTAWLSAPYVGLGDFRGLETMPREQFYEKALNAHRGGWQIGTHANGDLAIDRAISVYEQLQRLSPRRDPRFRVEHCTLVNAELVQRMKKVGAIPIPFAGYVRFHGTVMHFYGKDRLKNMFAMRDFIDAGIQVPSSSDYSASPPEPMLWLQSQVTRTDFTGHSWGLNQRITIPEAIRCGTRNGAYASFEEHLKGSLQPGLLADLVVWDHDILKTDPSELAGIKAERTMVEGRWVYES